MKALGSNPAHHLFLYGPQLRTIFIFLNGWGKLKAEFLDH